MTEIIALVFEFFNLLVILYLIVNPLSARLIRFKIIQDHTGKNYSSLDIITIMFNVLIFSLASFIEKKVCRTQGSSSS